MNQKLKKAVENAFDENSTANDIFIMLYQARYMEIESWAEIEDLIEEIFEERPEWHECKRLMRLM
jgi:hypothetical protein